jgi:hypothetical protein
VSTQNLFKHLGYTPPNSLYEDEGLEGLKDRSHWPGSGASRRREDHLLLTQERAASALAQNLHGEPRQRDGAHTKRKIAAALGQRGAAQIGPINYSDAELCDLVPSPYVGRCLVDDWFHARSRRSCPLHRWLMDDARFRGSAAGNLPGCARNL